MKNAFLILSYNHPDLTTRCLESILRVCSNSDNQVHPDAIILVHNGSEKKHREVLINRFPQIQHFEIENNAGYANGVNQSLRFAFKDFDRILFFTNDTELVELPKELPRERGLFAPLIYFRKLEKIDSLGGFFYPNLAKLVHIKNEKDFSAYFANTTSKVSLRRKIPYVPGSAFLIDRDIFIRMKGMDESLHTYWEDVDFSVRCFLNGENVGVIKDWKLLHRVGKTCHQKPFYTTYLYQRNRRIVSFRYANFFYKPFLFIIWFIPFVRLLWKNYRTSPQKFSLLLDSLRNSLQKDSVKF